MCALLNFSRAWGMHPQPLQHYYIARGYLLCLYSKFVSLRLVAAAWTRVEFGFGWVALPATSTNLLVFAHSEGFTKAIDYTWQQSLRNIQVVRLFNC